MGNLVEAQRHKMLIGSSGRYYCLHCGAYTYTFSVAALIDGEPCWRDS